MDVNNPTKAPTCPYRIKPRTAIAVCILVATAVGSVQVALQVRKYNEFTDQAFRLTQSFSAANAAGGPLTDYKPAFDALGRSDRAMGRMLAIAYIERTGSLGERDSAIVTAANTLTGRDLYRFLSAAAPMFDPSAREEYLERHTREVELPFVDMRSNTLTPDQKTAMRNCADQLKPIYSGDSIEARLKFAASLYTGARWETCSVPKQGGQSSNMPLRQSI